MKKEFKYSILQYKHSQLLKEAVNVGLLLYFPTEQRIEFVLGNAARIKTLYPDFNLAFFHKVIKNIENRIDKLKSQPQNVNNLDEFIHQRILSVDATVLQFTKAESSVLPDLSTDGLIENFADLFLPDRKADILQQQHVIGSLL
jgi:hypothetical protein